MTPRAAGGLRVIGGTARGLTLKQPRSEGTRPTTGRLREALFSMLEAAGADFASVLDLYAGSGALGIEALSRGDGEATFVESDARVAKVIRDNLARARFEGRGHVQVARVGRWRPPSGVTYTLVLADPPYDEAAPWRAIESSAAEALAEHAVIVVEHDARTAPPDTLAGRPLWRDRRQGAGAVAIYRADAKEEDA
ncbi:MAG: 16S rRNA (guanine(966)-N(2))-methyltransferase RsmD [Chloroflexi bacterium]|nr:16S rRNA (guanine(966)-N(2))-methyltransferase RsmD [Chloroflexota bacterium]MDA1240314.1 16S rRNA (guanine(966)-N(2))-methyltransferase RsmD [Chloroflexota bacterium]MQC47779.1 16S rRNA (guanine(966)-N(2))-methyltransferase RsmD [Chloroflexota bacterium]